MRTTVTIPDDLVRQAKRAAAERSFALSEVIQEALQKVFLQQRTTGEKQQTRLTTFRGRGVLPGIDLDNYATVLDAMEER